MSHSDMDRLKYLNKILLTELKNFIQRDNDSQNIHFDLEESSTNLDEETFEPILNEASTDSDIQTLITGKNEIKKENSICTIIEEPTEQIQSTPNAKRFLCHVCNKKYDLYFHLKQHIKNAHEKNERLHNQHAYLKSIQVKGQEIDKSEQLQLSSPIKKKKCSQQM